MRRRIHFQELAVIGKAHGRISFNPVQGIGQRHIAMAMMVTIGLAISGNVHQLRPVATVREAALQPVRKFLSAVQELFKGDGAGNRPVIKEEGDSFS